MEPPRHCVRIALVGYRGSGKSAVALLLAKRRDWSCIDTDERIEQQAGMTVRDIFSREGEPRFRALESQAVAAACGLERAVISVGGGAVLAESNREILRAAAFVIWLTASAETLATRLAGDARSASLRPALTDLDPLGEIRVKLAERSPLYARCAHITIDTTERDPEAVAEMADRLAPGGCA